MKITFISNYFNHHQKPLADEFYKLLGEGNYFFISTTDIPNFRKELGYKELKVPYLLHYKDDSKKCEQFLDDFDVVIYGASQYNYVKKRLNSGKLSFCYSERRYKTLSRYLKLPIHLYQSHYINKGYLLCSGAFVACDYALAGMKKQYCFKWGYFPEVKTYHDIDAVIKDKHKDYVSILWAGRLIGWKHPEVAIEVACRLKNEGKRFNMNIIGNGNVSSELQKRIKEKRLDDCVHLLGGMSPSDVRTYMEQAEIFLLTSNRQEGWGAVLNESMNSACAVVASDAIGSAPFLIKDGENGMTYHSGDIEELYEKVKRLINVPSERSHIQKAAYTTMCEVWSPENAAKSFMQIAKALRYSKSIQIPYGPCSLAF